MVGIVVARGIGAGGAPRPACGGDELPGVG
jgi:hypothetical protein